MLVFIPFLLLRCTGERGESLYICHCRNELGIIGNTASLTLMLKVLVVLALHLVLGSTFALQVQIILLQVGQW